MKRTCLLSFLLFLFFGCEDTIIYETDPRFFNDAFHGSIIGKIVQKQSSAIVIASQIDPVDTAYVDPEDGSFRIENIPIGNYDLHIIAENYRIYKHSNVMVTGAGTTYLGEIDLSEIPDLVSYHYPDDNDEIVYSNRSSRLTVSVTFTQPMDRESVEAAFSTQPASEGIFYWGRYTNYPADIYFRDYTNTFSEVGGEITTYSKITSFTYILSQKDSYVDTSYHVALSTEAKDTSGNYLRFPLNFSFKTIQSSTSINGIQTNPYHGDVDVNLITYDGIRVTFPRNMDKESTENAITVNPAKDIIYIWPERNILTIYTGGVFFADTTYYIEIDSTAEDLDGIKMGSPFSFSFSTAPVGVQSTNPRNGQLFVELNQTVNIYFNTYVTKSSVQNAFTITPPISGSFQYDPYNNSKNLVNFVPSGHYQKNTKYTITISGDAEDLFGSNLKDEYEFSFVTRPD